MSLTSEERQKIIERANQRNAASASVPPPSAVPGAAAPPKIRTSGGATVRVIDANNPPTQARVQNGIRTRSAGPASQGPRTLGANVVQPQSPGPKVRRHPQQGSYGATIVGGQGGPPLGQALRTPLGAPGMQQPGPSYAPPPSTPDLAAQIAASGAANAQNAGMGAPQVADGILGAVTVVLSQHVRPDALEQQYRALLAAGVAPQNIRCWVNPAGVRLNDGLLGKIQHVRSSPDMGPWARWMLATTAATKYVAVIDDDCIPGPQWLRKAVLRLEQAESDGESLIVAAAGGVYDADAYDQISLYGPESLHREEAFVDFGRGGWVTSVDVIRVIESYPKIGSVLATPIHVAAAAQKAGATIVVLPYPHSMREEWGMLAGPDKIMSMTARIDQGAKGGNGPSADQLRRADYEVYREALDWEPLCVLRANAEPSASPPTPDVEKLTDAKDD